MTAMRVGECSPPVARRRVARQLRLMREQARLTIDEAAPRLDLTRSSLSRLETGETQANVHVVRSMMDVYDQYSPELLDTVRAARRRGWWRGFGAADLDYVAWEAGASNVRELAVARVPELLQTEDYARALLAGKSVEPELTVRRIRQRRLSAGDVPLVVSVVVDEAALRNVVGGPGVMRAQLAHLATPQTAVTVRVLPAEAGAHLRVGGFRLLDFDHPADLPVVYLDSAVGVLREEHSKRVAGVRHAFDSIWAAALSVEESRTFIEQLAH